VRCVYGPPSGLAGLDELEDHRQGCSAGAGAAGDLGQQPNGEERGLDRVGSSQVDPVLGGEVEERQQLLSIDPLLVGTSPGKSKIVTRESFERAATDACART
jgi:hypothetical protein